MQALQLFRNISKMDSINKRNLNSKMNRLDAEAKWSNLKVESREASFKKAENVSWK